MNIFRILAPAVAGFLIDAFDFAAVYYTLTGIYFLAIVCILFLPRTSGIIVRGRNALTDIKEGIQYVRHQTSLLLVILFTLVGVLLSMPYILLLPIFTEDILKVGASGLGALMSVSGVGAIVGSLALASLPNKKRGLMLLVSSLLLSVALSFFAFSSSWSISLILIAFVGLGNAGQMTLSSTLLQYYSKDEFRGRVMSILMMQFGLMAFGAFGAGVLAEAVGVQWAIGGFAIVLVLMTMLALAFIPRLRRLD
jgi:predicted MFS family arabinose efflux permease